MPARVTASESADRIRRVCLALTDSRELRVAVVKELRSAIGFDAYAWLMTDPHTWVGSSPLADVPCLSELPTLIRLKYLTELNRWTVLPQSGVERLHNATSGDLGRSLVWAEMLHRFGVVDVASMAFVDRFGCWGFLDLWRSTAQPFTDDDAEFLARLVKPVTQALRRCQAATFAPSSAQMPAHADPAVLLLSAHLQVVGQTSQTEAYLRLLVPPDHGSTPVPAGAYNVSAQLLAREAGADDHPPRARVHVSGGTWLTLQAARIGSPAVDPSAQAEIAVTIELASPRDRAGIYASAHGFTTRESQILDRMLTGADTRDLAGGLYLSEHTVQDYLKAMFAKTGTSSRRQLLSRVTGV